MNEIKLSGKVIKKESLDNKLFIKLIIELPTKMKVVNDGEIERINNYISVILFSPSSNDYPEIKRNTYIEIRGELLENINKDDEKLTGIIIMPKTIKRGVKI